MCSMTHTQRQTQSDLRYGTTQPPPATSPFASSQFADQDVFPHIRPQPLLGSEKVRPTFRKETPEKMNGPVIHHNTKIPASPSQPHGEHAIPEEQVSTTYEGPTVELRNGSQHGFTKDPVPSPQLPIARDHAAAHIEPDEAIRAQENIQDAREDLLGFRFALRSQRKELAHLRREAGEVEGAIFSHFQQIFHDNRIPFPDKLLKDYHRAGILRDRLGFSEAEYDDGEQKYNGLEYEYTQKESSFVDTIVSRVPPSPSAVRYHSCETESLTKFAEGPNELVGGNTPRSLELLDDPSKPPAAGHDRGSQMQTRKASREFETPGLHHSQAFSPRTPSSLPQIPTRFNHLPHAGAPSVSKSESSMLDARKHWPETLKRIDSWILDATTCSPLHKAFLKNLLSEAAGLNDPSWWDLVLKHWASTEYNTIPHPIDDSHLSTESISTSPGHRYITPVSINRPAISKLPGTEPVAPRNVTSLGQQTQGRTDKPEMDNIISMEIPTYSTAMTYTTRSVPERSTDIRGRDAQSANVANSI